jgi:uncharacterized iron-regulated membrane protein
MQLLKWGTWAHKWIALIVGVQILFWVFGGLVMTAIPIERVRSEHHLAEGKPATLPLERIAELDAVARGAGAPVTEAVLKSTPRGPLWQLKTADGRQVHLDAATGAVLGPISADQARAAAVAAYVGSGDPVAVRWFGKAPQETGREGPIWRVEFDDEEKTDFYLSPWTGEVLTRRSDVWRFYDFFWRLHILDFDEGDDFNHPLLILAAAASLVVVLSGFILLWFRLARDWTVARAKRRGSDVPS